MKKHNLRFDEFTALVHSDPNSSDQIVLLCGYIGKSNLDDHVRVYFDEELNNFVEVPESDILHCIPKDKSEDSLGGSRLWIKQSTIVTYGDPSSANRPKSSFLEGDLMQAYGDMGIGYPGTAGQSAQQAPNAATIIEGPRSIAAPCITVTRVITQCKPTLLRTCFGPTCLKVTCLQTCIGKTCCQVTLNRTCKTCFQPSCRPTCNVFQQTCGITCNNPTCKITCEQPSCAVTCLKPTCIRTQCFTECRTRIQDPFCQITRPPGCVISDPVGCPWTGPETPQTPVINPGNYYEQSGFGGYTGSFNPYNTGY